MRLVADACINRLSLSFTILCTYLHKLDVTLGGYDGVVLVDRVVSSNTVVRTALVFVLTHDKKRTAAVNKLLKPLHVPTL